jgi:WD40 repeat protein
MANTAQPIIPTTTPVRVFEAHEDTVCAITLFHDTQRMVTGSKDNTLRLWNLKNGTMLKTMKGHRTWVQGVAVSRDGQLIASSDIAGVLIAWNGETGECLRPPIQAHKKWIRWIELSPDGTMLATGSSDTTTKIWSTENWQLQGTPIDCGSEVFCVRYSPSGGLLAIATSNDIRIMDTRTRKCIANFKAHARTAINKSWNVSLAWTPNSTRLLSGGTSQDPTVREWDTFTWEQVGDPWTGHSGTIYNIVVNSRGTLIASASQDNHVRLWRLSDRQTIAIFEHVGYVFRVTFSMDDKYIFSGGKDKRISKWAIPEEALPNSKVSRHP